LVSYEVPKCNFAFSCVNRMQYFYRYFVIDYLVVLCLTFIVSSPNLILQKRREQQEDNHPLEGSLKKRMKLFSGGVFQRKKNGALADDIEAGNDTPAFIEISSVRSGMSNGQAGRSVVVRTPSYKAPQGPVLSGFDDSDDDESCR
jgi:hypothetical protein